jgi:hypothetical protein
MGGFALPKSGEFVKLGIMQVQAEPKNEIDDALGALERFVAENEDLLQPKILCCVRK